MQTNMPIGLFDSGVGATTIWKEVVSLLPNENTLLLADNKNAPYGTKSKEEIIYLSEQNTEFLLNHNAKIIVVACNTATTNAISHLRRKYEVPFIGIEPAIKPASLQSQTKIIGVLATRGTLSSDLFHKTRDSFVLDKGIEIVEQQGDGLVELIENGEIASEAMQKLLKKYIQPMVEASVDYIVLGCTHYPYLIPEIQKIIPSSITILDSGKAIARQVQYILEEKNLQNIKKTSENIQHHWVSTKNEAVFIPFLPKNIPVLVFIKENYASKLFF